MMYLNNMSGVLLLNGVVGFVDLSSLGYFVLMQWDLCDWFVVMYVNGVYGYFDVFVYYFYCYFDDW